MYEHNRMMVDQLIDIQRKSLVSYVIYTIVILLMALILYLGGRVFSNPSVLNAIDITSTFVSSLSGLSIKEIIDKKRCLDLVKNIKSSVDNNQNNPSQQEMMRMTLQTLMSVMI